MKKLFVGCAVLALFAAAGGAFAGDPAMQGTVHTITLPDIQTKMKPGPGVDKVTGLCSICHTLDYITMQPPLSRAQWTGTVNKMIKVMGAPINEQDEKTIIDYLSAEYGNGK